MHIKTFLLFRFFIYRINESNQGKKMSSTQEITKCLKAREIKEYIKHTLNDPYDSHYPEDYTVVGKL